MSEDVRFDLLIGYLEDELDPAEREQVEALLETDSAAQEALAGYRELGGALAELGAPAPSAEARARASAALLAAMTADAPPEAEAPRASSAGGEPQGRLLRFLPLAAAAALLLSSGLILLQPGPSGTQAEVASAPRQKLAPEASEKAKEPPRAARGGAAEALAPAPPREVAAGLELEESFMRESLDAAPGEAQAAPGPSAGEAGAGAEGASVDEDAADKRANETLGAALEDAAPGGVDLRQAEALAATPAPAAKSPPMAPQASPLGGALSEPEQGKLAEDPAEPSPAEDSLGERQEGARSRGLAGAKFGDTKGQQPSPEPEADADGAVPGASRPGAAPSAAPVAWVVTRGERRRVYVLKGQEVRVRSLPALKRALGAPSQASSAAEVVILERVPTPSGGERPVDLDRSAEREDLLAIASYEFGAGEVSLAESAKRRSSSGSALGGRAQGVAGGEASPADAPSGAPAGELEKSEQAERETKRAELDSAEAAGGEARDVKAVKELERADAQALSAGAGRLKRAAALLRLLQGSAAPDEVEALRTTLRQVEAREAAARARRAASESR